MMGLFIPAPLVNFLRTLRLCSCHLAALRTAIPAAKTGSSGIHLRCAAFILGTPWLRQWNPWAI